MCGLLQVAGQVFTASTEGMGAKYVVIFIFKGIITQLNSYYISD